MFNFSGRASGVAAAAAGAPSPHGEDSNSEGDEEHGIDEVAGAGGEAASLYLAVSIAHEEGRRVDRLIKGRGAKLLAAATAATAAKTAASGGGAKPAAAATAWIASGSGAAGKRPSVVR